MDSQPNEIITHLLSYLDNYTLMFARGICHKWKYLIETRIFYKSNIPALHVCLLNQDYYHFGKYYSNHNYDTNKLYIYGTEINDVMCYNNLVNIITEKNIINKIFHNIIPWGNLKISMGKLLLYASNYGHLEVVKYLINIGANFRVNNDIALRWSTKNGHLEVVQYLISIGADLHVDNDFALLWSAQNGHLEVVKYLISVGANFHVDNDYALRYGTPKVIEFLKSISGKN